MTTLISQYCTIQKVKKENHPSILIYWKWKEKNDADRKLANFRKGLTHITKVLYYINEVIYDCNDFKLIRTEMKLCLNEKHLSSALL